jgi:hypothetical protein
LYKGHCVCHCNAEASSFYGTHIDKVVTDKCPYCGNDLENKPVSAENMILPEGILPFKVDLSRAASAFQQWTSGLWFAPNDLKQLADLGKFNGVYVPFWTYDAMTYTFYDGERGDNYTVTVMVTRRDANGREIKLPTT